MTKRGRATVYQTPTTVSDAPLEDKNIYVQTGLKRSQICARHNTQLIGGKCKRCVWEKNPKRAATPSAGVNKPDALSRTNANKTVEV